MTNSDPLHILTIRARLIQRFDWINTDGLTEITFNVTEMLDAILDLALPATAAESPLDPAIAENWIKVRELNLDYIKSLSPEQINTPVLGVSMPPDNATLIIDGSHRYVAAVLRKLPMIRYFLVELPHWLPFASIKGKWPCA